MSEEPREDAGTAVEFEPERVEAVRARIDAINEAADMRRRGDRTRLATEHIINAAQALDAGIHRHVMRSTEFGKAGVAAMKDLRAGLKELKEAE